ncbi:hypothetical protein Q5752_001444 [Cryptotrichosporon argae]
MSRREQDALLAYLNAFKLSRRVVSFDQLADGRAFFELTRSDATHFKNTASRGATAPSTSSADNWVLKMNTLKRLYRLLLSYPLTSPRPATLALTRLPEPQFSTIAKNPKSPDGSAGLLQIARFCLAVGAMGAANATVIPKIQGLDEDSMSALMQCIESVMDTLPSEKEDDQVKDHLHSPRPLSPPVNARKERDRLLQENDDLRAQIEQLNEQMSSLSSNLEEAKADKEDVTARLAALKGDGGAGLRSSQSATSEVDRLRAELTRAEEHSAETEAALEKQTATVADMTKTIDELKEQSAESARLKDQLEEYRHTAERLQKSENVIEKYKKKLEESAGLRRELKNLEAENAALVDKTAELEAEVRKAGSAKATLDSYRSQVEALEKRVAGQTAELADLTLQLETTQAHLGDVEHQHERDREDLHLHQERVKELELGAGIRSSSMQLKEENLGDEIGVADDDVGNSKTDLKLKIRALQRELASYRHASPDAHKLRALETLVADANRARDQYQSEYLEARRESLVLQARLDQIRSGRGGDSAQTALALQQRLDEVTEERDRLLKTKQAIEVAKEDVERQLKSAKLDLSVVDKDQRSMLASLRETVKRENIEVDDLVVSLKGQIAELKDKDRVNLEEIRRLLVEKVDLQSAGISQREKALAREMDINNMRASLVSKGVNEETTAEMVRLAERNAELEKQVEEASEKLEKAKEFIKNQDTLFRAEHLRPVVDFGEAQKSYEAQITTLRRELQSSKAFSAALERRYKLEQQLILSAWHDMGSRIVHDHLAQAATRRPVARPQPTAWLGRQRRHQDEAVFSR